MVLNHHDTIYDVIQETTIHSVVCESIVCACAKSDIKRILSRYGLYKMLEFNVGNLLYHIKNYVGIKSDKNKEKI